MERELEVGGRGGRGMERGGAEKGHFLQATKIMCEDMPRGM